MIIQGIRQGIECVYRLTGDYGVAIVFITIGIRMLMIPLNIQQRKQLEKQQKISREVERLKSEYKNNAKKRDEELQKLYQEQGMGGGACLVTLIQFPIMMCLYEGIRLTAAAGAATLLLPWVSSLLVRDQTFILPAATLIVQVLPQAYPYIGCFKALKLQKTSVPMVLTLMLTNSIFAFMLPSGVGLYYFVSGLFTAAEQFLMNCAAVRKAAQTVA